MIKSAQNGNYCCKSSTSSKIKCEESCKDKLKFHAISNADDVAINRGGGDNLQDRCALWSSDHQSYLNVGLPSGNTLQTHSGQTTPDDNRMYFVATDVGNGRVRIKNMGGEKCLKLNWGNKQIKAEECSGLLNNCPGCIFELVPEVSYGGRIIRRPVRCLIKICSISSTFIAYYI